MNTKTNEATRAPQSEVAIAEDHDEDFVELRQMVDKKLHNLIGMWKDRKEQSKILESSGPTLPGGYKYWDCILLGPYQKSTFDQPSKIVVGGEPALMVGLIWINQEKDPSGGVSGKVVMGGREYYRCFEMINLSLVQNVVLPDSDKQETFPDIPPEFIPVYWEFTLPDPGIHPLLYEVHFYVDVVRAGQPFATFATWRWDPDHDGWFPGWTATGAPAGYPVDTIPGTGWPWAAHFDHDIPARFLVHRA